MPSTTLTIRPFRNSDPPAIAKIWRQSCSSSLQDVMCPVPLQSFERLVFGRPYFDSAGLYIAFENERPVGFAHAGFPPEESGEQLATDRGVICMVRVCDDVAQKETALGLLQNCEEYLRERGARKIFGGAATPAHPFYLGLYGGAVMPGVTDTDQPVQSAFRSAGYNVERRLHLLRQHAREFSRPVDTRMVALRSAVETVCEEDPAPKNRWEAWCAAHFPRVRFRLVDVTSSKPVAGLIAHVVDCDHCDRKRVGILDMRVVQSQQGKGLASFLISEVVEHFARWPEPPEIEAAIPADEEPLNRLFGKLGFRRVISGTVFCKEMS